MALKIDDLKITWPDWANLALGVWLFVSVWLLDYSGIAYATWNGLFFGALIAVMAVAALMQWRAWEEWIGVAVGLWLIVSPWVLGFRAFTEGAAYAATMNTILVGLAVLLLSAWSVHAHREAGAH